MRRRIVGLPNGDLGSNGYYMSKDSHSGSVRIHNDIFDKVFNLCKLVHNLSGITVESLRADCLWYRRRK